MSKLVLVAAASLLVAVSPSAGAVGESQPTPKVLNSSPTAMKTSSNPVNLFSDNPTTAVGFLLLDVECASLGDSAAAVPSSVVPSVRQRYLQAPPAIYKSPASGTCGIDVAFEVSKSDPSNGTILLAPPVPAATPSNLPPSAPRLAPSPTSVPYVVERTSVFYIYVLVFALAISLGLLAGTSVARGINEKRRTKATDLPDGFEYGKAWAGTTTAIGAIGTALLGGTGVLKEFLPQYQTGGVIVANIVVALIIAAAPATFVALYTGKSSDRAGRALRVAASITYTGIAAQLLLDLLLVLYFGIPSYAGGIVAFCILVLLWAVYKYMYVVATGLLESPATKKIPASM